MLTEDQFPPFVPVTFTVSKDAPVQKLTVPELKALIEKVCNVSFKQVESHSRKPNIVTARFLYYYFMRKAHGTSLNEVTKNTGQHFTAPIKAKKIVIRRLESKDPFFNEFKEQFSKLDSLIL